MNSNIELLEYMYTSSNMGVSTLTNLLKEINDKENKLKGVISSELSKYEKFYKESKILLKKMKAEIKEDNLIKKFMAKNGIKMEIRKDNSDANVAHMLIEGFTMGVVDIESKIKNLDKKVDKKIINLAQNYLNFQREEIENLKIYL